MDFSLDISTKFTPFAIVEDATKYAQVLQNFSLLQDNSSLA